MLRWRMRRFCARLRSALGQVRERERERERDRSMGLWGNGAVIVKPSPQKQKEAASNGVGVQVLPTISVASFNAAHFQLAAAIECPPPQHHHHHHLPRVHQNGDRAKNTRTTARQRRPSSYATKGTQAAISTRLGEQRYRDRKGKGLADSNLHGGSSSATSSSSVVPPLSPLSSRRDFKALPIHCPWSSSASPSSSLCSSSRHTIHDILLQANADVVALQNVKADEADNMRPLSDLARGLGMHFAFAESWAPQFGHAILSRWPLKDCKEHSLNGEAAVCNRKLLQVVVDVPFHGELQITTTHLDHLDETCRLQEASSIGRLLKGIPHILAANLNALDASDYSSDRWNSIAKMRAANGKFAPKQDVLAFLKQQLGYSDCKDYAGESIEAPVVILPPGQSVQGTCKDGTRVDYVLASSCFPYRFVPGSYTVLSSRGTSDHHVLRVEIEPLVAPRI